MNLNLTEIVLVVDRSGSMSSMAGEATNGIKRFLSDQEAQPGESRVTLVHFDDVVETVFDGVSPKDVQYKIEPRGSTALNDAVGKTINMIGIRLANTAEEQRPGLVMFCIITDGMENASQEFSAAKIKEMIEHQRTVYQWQFTFLAAGEACFSQSEELGLTSGGSAYSSMDGAYLAVSMKASRMRKSVAESGVLNSAMNEFTLEEKEMLKKKD